MKQLTERDIETLEGLRFASDDAIKNDDLGDATRRLGDADGLRWL